MCFQGQSMFLFFSCAGVHARRLHVFTLQRQQPRYINIKVVEVCCFSFCVAAAKREDRNQTLVWFGCRLMYFVSLKWSKERQTSFTVRRGAHDEELHHFKHANRPFFFSKGDILTGYSRERTGGINYFNDGCIPFR